VGDIAAILDLTAPVPRHIEAHVRTALSDMRVVAIVGPRQSGKTTLVRKLAREDGRTYFTPLSSLWM